MLDEELSSLLSSWFDIGNLELRRISWSSPAALLEKLIAYEAVHEIRSWTDLRNRLDSDRRCYAFFHPRMPDEPLIFVEIALVKDMADNIHGLLDESAPAFDPHAAQAAIFYSISNTQVGLKGVSFGGFLIKRVADMLAADFPKLKVFATLSPVPGFRRWLDAEAKRKSPDFFGKQERERLCEEADLKDPHEALAQLLLRGFAAEAHPPESVRTTLHAPLRALPRRGEGAGRYGSRRTPTSGRSIRSRASISATARGSSASTGSPTRARGASSSRRG